MADYLDRTNQAVEDIDGLLVSTGETWDARRFLLRHLPMDLLWSVVIATILTLILTPFFSAGPSLWLQGFIFNLIVSLCIGLSVSNALRFLVPPLRRFARGGVAGILLYAIVAIGGTALGAESAVRLIEAIGGMRAADFRADVFRIGFVVVTVIFASEVAYGRLRRRARRDELSAQQARKQALRAELRALQARTNPHFLFNSLNTVAGLIDENPGAAENVLEKLAGLFRYSLKGTEVNWVRLAEEVEAIESYLEVETIRLGDRLRSEVRVEGGAGEALVPPLILQPLVENAVLHAIAPRKSGGRVRVGAATRNSRLELIVSDDGDGVGSSPHRGSGTSLSELENRLEIIYEGKATFESGPSSTGGFEIRLALPLESTA